MRSRSFVFTGLLANQGADAPNAVQPYIRARSAEPPENLDDIRRHHPVRIIIRPVTAEDQRRSP
jgi:hypothetical protein